MSARRGGSDACKLFGSNHSNAACTGNQHRKIGGICLANLSQDGKGVSGQWHWKIAAMGSLLHHNTVKHHVFELHGVVGDFAGSVLTQNLGLP